MPWHYTGIVCKSVLWPDRQWASCQIRKIAGCACAGNARNVFPAPRVSDPDMHHVTHVPWCMPGSLNGGFLWSRWRGKRPRHSRRMRNLQFYVSGKSPWASSTEVNWIESARSLIHRHGDLSNVFLCCHGHCMYNGSVCLTWVKCATWNDHSCPSPTFYCIMNGHVGNNSCDVNPSNDHFINPFYDKEWDVILYLCLIFNGSLVKLPLK